MLAYVKTCAVMYICITACASMLCTCAYPAGGGNFVVEYLVEGRVDAWGHVRLEPGSFVVFLQYYSKSYLKERYLCMQ